MSGIATAVVAGAVISGTMSSRAQKKAAASAASAQKESTDTGIAEQQRQFDAVQKLLGPYVNAGTGALGAQQNILGLNGAEAQRQAMAGIESSPQFASLSQQGENAILGMLRQLVVFVAGTFKERLHNSGLNCWLNSLTSNTVGLAACLVWAKTQRLA